MTKITQLDKAEAGHLREAVKRLEAALASGIALTGNTNSMLLGRLIDDANRRIEAITETEKEALAEEREKSVRELAFAIIAQREAALTATEQRQYAEFLSRESFTRADFGKLEEFYRSAWDRLSESGKAEMSHRIWEGVRRDEYKFSELPDIVKEKEARSLYEALKADRPEAHDLRRIPKSDRDDFVREWESGNRAASYEVLNRPSIAGNVALTAKASVAAAPVEKPVALEAAKSEAVVIAASSKTSGNVGGEVELNLSDIALVNADAAKIAAPLPAEAKNSAAKSKGH